MRYIVAVIAAATILATGCIPRQDYVWFNFQGSEDDLQYYDQDRVDYVAVEFNRDGYPAEATLRLHAPVGFVFARADSGAGDIVVSVCVRVMDADTLTPVAGTDICDDVTATWTGSDSAYERVHGMAIDGEITMPSGTGHYFISAYAGNEQELIDQYGVTELGASSSQPQQLSISW